MTSLVGQIPIQYNRVTPVFMFAYVLLFGFAVKTIMLCPGIFQPYKRSGCGAGGVRPTSLDGDNGATSMGDSARAVEGHRR